MSGKRAAILVLAVVGGVALVLMLRGGSGDDKKKPTAKAPSSAAAESTDSADNAEPRSRPALRPRAKNRPEPRTTVRDDGTVVRDHRTKTAASATSATRSRPSTSGPAMTNTRIRAVRTAMHPVVNECAERHPVTSTAKKAKLRVILSVDIADDRLSVKSAAARGNGIKDPEALLECVRSQMEVMDLPADGHPDVTGYKLRMGFPLTPSNP